MWRFVVFYFFAKYYFTLQQTLSWCTGYYCKDNWEDDDEDKKKEENKKKPSQQSKKPKSKLEEKIEEREVCSNIFEFLFINVFILQYNLNNWILEQRKERTRLRKQELEEEVDFSNMTPEQIQAEKLRRQKIIEEADFEVAKEMLGWYRIFLFIELHSYT